MPKEPSKELVVIDKDNLPEVLDLLLSVSWKEDARWLIKYGPGQEFDQAAQLLAERQAFQSLAAHCKSEKLHDTATYAMMLGMAKKWGVELDDDTDPFFIETISRAVEMPSGTELIDENGGELFDGVAEDGLSVVRGTKLYGFMDLVNAEFKVNWIMQGLLTEMGVFSFAGPSGVGKTQLVIRWCIALATGGDFLGFKVTDGRPRKILFLSMEMIDPEIHSFYTTMLATLNDEQRALLQENFIVWPTGTPLYLNDPVDRAEYCKLIDLVKPDGVIIDSWSQAVKGTLQDDTVTRDAFGFINFLRKKTGAFFGIINHTRKGQKDSLPNTMDGIFGSAFFAAALSGAIVVWCPDKSRPNNLELHFVKSRFAPNPGEALVIRRTQDLEFILDAKSFSALDVLIPKNASKQIEPPKKVGLLSKTLGELGGDFTFSLPDSDGNPIEITPYSKLDETIEGFEI